MSFEQHIKDYYRERLGGEYIIRDFGFVAYRIRDGVIYFDEFFVAPKTSFRDTFSLIHDIFTIGRQAGCTYLVGMNDPLLDTYERIKKLHQYFKLTDSGQRDGHRELWVREL